jgi:hypothetical protein
VKPAPSSPETLYQLAGSVERIARFSGKNLASKIAELEFKFANLQKQDIVRNLNADSIDGKLLDAARLVKHAAAQIDVVLHSLGILVLLPSILEDGEVVESLSLGAGSSEAKRFDLETNRRIAEFTFIEWTGNDNTRLQKIFKDFYRIAEFNTPKRKEIWLTDDTYALKYLRSGTSIRSATHKHRDIWENFQAKYPSIEKVRDYYRLRAENVIFRVYTPPVPRSAELPTSEKDSLLDL